MATQEQHQETVMNPWTIIGWIVLVLLGASLSAILINVGLLPLARAIDLRVRHLRTRNDVPAEGQRWLQGGRMITVQKIMDDGRIVLSTGTGGSSSGWSDSPDEWRRRVRNRRLWRAR
jgi:hypothetical protein